LASDGFAVALWAAAAVSSVAAMIELLTTAEMGEADRLAIAGGIAGIALMENAGQAVADRVAAAHPAKARIVVVAGPGNNGGDGFVIARHLDNHEWPVKAWLFAPARATETPAGWVVGEPKLPPDAATNFRVWQHGRDVPIVEQDSRTGPSGWPKLLADDIRAAGWVVDALFGTGLTRLLTMPYAVVVATLNSYEKPTLAVDIPSGLDCDTGEPLGPTVRATHTATFVAPKRGFLNPAAREWTGEAHVIDIGAPRALVNEYRRRQS